MNAPLRAPTLAERLREQPFQDYLYAYPHKTSYRPLDPGVPLEQAWADEPTDALFLYIHVPFCGVRCGFCNLFTASNPRDDLVERWLAALEREAAAVRRALPTARFARFALGGGTPTHLTAGQLERVLDLAESLGADLPSIPAGVETSPDTATPDRLALLRGRGVDRISMGVQSFREAETKAALRPQRTRHVLAAIDAIRTAGFPTLNLDLIYGLPGQTFCSWADTLDSALACSPEELFLYPLYVRPGTGLGVQATRRGGSARAPGALPITTDDRRPQLHRRALDTLTEAGFEQRSLRFFRHRNAPAPGGDDYACQRDGMVGLGVGARSYTRGLHYASRYAVGARPVRALIDDYAARTDFDRATWGIQLDATEQQRRFAILSLLHVDGLDAEAFAARFDTPVRHALPQLVELTERGLAAWDDGVLRLTAAGLERSDTIGPWLITDRVRTRMLAAEVA